MIPGAQAGTCFLVLFRVYVADGEIVLELGAFVLVAGSAFG